MFDFVSYQYLPLVPGAILIAYFVVIKIVYFVRYVTVRNVKDEQPTAHTLTSPDIVKKSDCPTCKITIPHLDRPCPSCTYILGVIDDSHTTIKHCACGETFTSRYSSTKCRKCMGVMKTEKRN